jgi:hypothetical protein
MPRRATTVCGFAGCGVGAGATLSLGVGTPGVAELVGVLVGLFESTTGAGVFPVPALTATPITMARMSASAPAPKSSATTTVRFTISPVVFCF